MRALGRLAGFFVLGALLALARGHWAAPDRPVVRVRVQAGASDAEREAAADEAVLVELGRQAGWVETDPLIRDRLVRNVGFLEPELAAAAALAHARALGMDHTDPIVRLRLVSRARALLDAPLEAADPGDDALAAWQAAHAERFERPAKIELSQVFLSRDRRGAALAVDASALLLRLRAERPDPKRAARLGDPLVILRSIEVTSPAALDDGYGEGFGQALLGAPVQAWSGPHASRFGLHLVWIHRREPAAAPDLGSVRGKVLSGWREARRLAHRAERLAALRGAYDVRVEDAP